MRRLLHLVLRTTVSVLALCAAAVGGVSVSSRGLASAPTSADLVVRNGGVTAVFAKRLAGAAYRVEWDGHLVIPELEGNGGSLQTALAFDVRHRTMAPTAARFTNGRMPSPPRYGFTVTQSAW